MIKNQIEIRTWAQFTETVTDVRFRSWAFRGQADASWPIKSTLSRYLTDFHVHRDAWSKQEARLLRIFKRKSHIFLSKLPDPEDSFEWLAIMQHHGAPTRLLDFTWSPYVACFFALEMAQKNCAIWAVYPPGLSVRGSRTIRASQTVLPDEIGPWVKGSYEKYFLTNENSFVFIGEPDNMNQRLIAQSGTFVIPGRLDQPVNELVDEESIVKITLITEELRKHAMSELYKMNITNATLFPGLDGLAKSLTYELETHWAYDPITMEPYKGFHID
ncbi:FRG domain-containing protein [Dyadobacter koreensis]|uniref:FRG domain-containing protein n=1 Tax=Dyadobacter koreensis TaxID=408657 RepID=A0A1H7B9N3_9BACT|nr:FRG domain-containing protein [Dyadobacter koreensis]SEJ71010.1 FRG domain-containing protein [Dyadobacter koreensis]